VLVLPRSRWEGGLSLCTCLSPTSVSRMTATRQLANTLSISLRYLYSPYAPIDLTPPCCFATLSTTHHCSLNRTKNVVATA